MARHLQRSVDKLKETLLRLASSVEQRVEDAAKSLLQRDRQVAQQVVNSDNEIDRMEVDLEEDCLETLALHQPVATDLRLIIAILKINNDLERIADLAVNIAARSVSLMDQPLVAIPFDLEGMSKLTVDMLHQSMNSLVKMDVAVANKTRAIDDQVDAMTQSAFRAVEEGIRRNPEFLGQLIEYLSCARHLERIADLAANICEDVVYMVEGEIVRHKPSPV